MPDTTGDLLHFVRFNLAGQPPRFHEELREQLHRLDAVSEAEVTVIPDAGDEGCVVLCVRVAGTEGLERYRLDPTHLEVAAWLRSHAVSAQKMDVEVSLLPVPSLTDGRKA